MSSRCSTRAVHASPEFFSFSQLVADTWHSLIFLQPTRAQPYIHASFSFWGNSFRRRRAHTDCRTQQKEGRGFALSLHLTTISISPSSSSIFLVHFICLGHPPPRFIDFVKWRRRSEGGAIGLITNWVKGRNCNFKACYICYLAFVACLGCFPSSIPLPLLFVWNWWIWWCMYLWVVSSSILGARVLTSSSILM